jgi:NAD(P)-dependent dehydrogenase (short-subunit alcohol dehydrogenase family)
MRSSWPDGDRAPCTWTSARPTRCEACTSRWEASMPSSARSVRPISVRSTACPRRSSCSASGANLLSQIRLVLLGRSLISDGGSFTLVSGYLLDDPIPVGAGFSVANGGVEGFVRSAALSLDRGVRINAVSPGLAEDSDEQFARFNRAASPSPCPPSAPPSSAAWRGGAPEKPSGPGDHVNTASGALRRRAIDPRTSSSTPSGRA